MTGEFWARLLGILIVDLTLAGDNALVIALAVRTLPRRQQIAARLWGSAGAVGLRLAFIAIVTYLLTIPLLQFVGGLALLWIAVRLVRQLPEAKSHARETGSLWSAVWVIMVADLVMSLDNVVAVAGTAKGDFLLVTIGIAVSLPLVVWGSGLLARLMGRYPWIVWLGGGVLGYVAGDMILHDVLVDRWLGPTGDVLDVTVPIVFAIALAALGWWLSTHRTRSG
jgi:YjbE family integral membrane protein